MELFSIFHIYYKAKELFNYRFKQQKFLPALASCELKVYPYQIAAAQFVLRSPYLKGTILCDESSLGKTYEALLVISQMWYEDKNRILIVVPTPLLHQWAKIIEQKLCIPLFSIDNNTVFNDFIKIKDENPFYQDGIIITTYDFAAKKHEYIEQIDWNLCVFEEAHHLRKIYINKNKEQKFIHQAVKGSFKLLLTSTPMQNSILDLYGLINFIDDKVFSDENTFYKKYFRKSENYNELASRINPYCFRTTRAQAATYVKIPERILITANFVLSDEEQALYNLIDKYVQKDNKYAFPQMDKYDLALMLFHTFSSSSFAFKKTINRVFHRLSEVVKKENSNEKIKEELTEIKQMYETSESIKENSKGMELLKALKSGFSRLKKVGANKKALIFTENLETQKYLYKLLSDNGYNGKVLTFNGSCSRDYSIIENFKEKAEILISTDIASEGFNLEFCSFVINYDFPYNILTIEQRISRCHRQGQQCDVIVLNFLNKNNFSDVRMLELINKRIIQFNGVFGMSDCIAGNFESDVSNDFRNILKSAKSKKEIDKAFNEILEDCEPKNQKIIETSRHSLYTSFSDEIANKVTITPEYIGELSPKINNDLWQITKFFFKEKREFHIDETTRTISCFGTPPKIFTGSRMGRNEYSMDKNYRPKSGIHTIIGPLAKNIFNEIFWNGVPDEGTIKVNKNISPCSMAYYSISVKSENHIWDVMKFNTFIGKTSNGQILNDDECKKIMDIPIISFTKQGDTYGEKDGISKQKLPHPLDNLISTESFVKEAMSEIDTASNDEINRLKSYTKDLKTNLNKNIERTKRKLNALEKDLYRVNSREEKINLKKEISLVQKELKQSQENLFLDNMKLESELEDNIDKIIKSSKLTAEVKREFVIKVYGNDKEE